MAGRLGLVLAAPGRAWDSLGLLLGGLGGSSGALGLLFWGSRGALGAAWVHLGWSWGFIVWYQGSHWAALGNVFGFLGRSWWSWAFLGGLGVLRRRLGSVLGHSCGRLGRSRGLLAALACDLQHQGG